MVGDGVIRNVSLPLLPLKSTIEAGSMFLGSTIEEFTLVKILNSSATRTSYP